MEIRINQPCSENWDHMTAGDNSRFCNRCATRVIDFTHKSNEEIRNYLRSHAGQKVCGRMFASQMTLPRPEFVVRPRVTYQPAKETNLYFHLLAIATVVLAGCQSPENKTPEKPAADNLKVWSDTSGTNDSVVTASAKKPVEGPDKNHAPDPVPVEEAPAPLMVEMAEPSFQDTIVLPLEENSSKGSREDVLGFFEIPPSFPDGDEALYAFLYHNTQYPKWEMENGIEGRVVVRFIIDKAGKAKNFTIVRSVTANFDAEVLRVMKLMPDWEPGKQNGRVVDTWFSLPVNFELPPKTDK